MTWSLSKNLEDLAHQACCKQVEKLRVHLLELDKELEAESCRHELERTKFLGRIQELEEMLQERIEINVGTDDGSSNDSGLRVENSALKDQLSSSQQKISDLEGSLSLLELSTCSDQIYINDII